MEMCCFCGKNEDEALLIDIATNILLIGLKHYEFSHIFHELLGTSESDFTSTFICDVCKDSAVNFFIFKKNVTNNENPHRKMILSQIDDFLKQTKNLEEILVVRKLHTITLQVDLTSVTKSPQQLGEEKEVESDNEDFFSEAPVDEEEIIEEEVVKEIKEDVTVVVVSNYVVCTKCDQEISNEPLEIHEFFKHSLLGLQIENEAETSQQENSLKSCGTCSTEFGDSTTLAHHLVVEHSSDFLSHVNQAFGLNLNSVNLTTVNNYLRHIKELIFGNQETEVDKQSKQYFYDVYCAETAKSNENFDDIQEETYINSNFDEPTNFKQPPKHSKCSVSFSSLDEESREWIRTELIIRRFQVENEFGVSRDIFRCGYCNTSYCAYSSNSASGFRYHLINKHLKDASFREQKVVETDFVVPIVRKKTGRNICIDCNLKFKDQKLLTSHLNCHELFETVAHYYAFPSCHTCNFLYIDDSSLNIHLNKHDAGKDVTQAIQVPAGAVVIQGKRATEQNQANEVPTGDFSWCCGHCSKKFNKEDQCRFHLLMVHAAFFTCPMDKRDFSGYKAVSLFSHHLKNKHPELFPDMIFPCTFCNSIFNSIYEKLSHMKNCNEKKFECDHCQKKFFKKADLVSHLKFISGEHYFQCKTCEKKCETLSDLKIHFRSHTKEKPFLCAMCNKSFRTLAARSAHVEGHNTNISYMCHCGKSFKQRHIYRRHVKAFHEGDAKQESITIQSKLEVME